MLMYREDDCWMIGSCNKYDGSGEETGLGLGSGFEFSTKPTARIRLCKRLAERVQADCVCSLRDIPSRFTAFSQELCVFSLP